MEKITLKLFDILNLEADINGLVNQQNGEPLRKGLLSFPLPMTTKYWLTKLAKTVGEEKKIIDGLRDELVKKYGEEKDGQIIVPRVIPDLDKKGNPVKVMIKNAEGNDIEVDKMILNPVFLEFDKEYSEVLNQEKELEYRPFSLEDFKTKDNPNGLESEETYDTFFKLIKELSE